MFITSSLRLQSGRRLHPQHTSSVENVFSLVSMVITNSTKRLLIWNNQSCNNFCLINTKKAFKKLHMFYLFFEGFFSVDETVKSIPVLCSKFLSCLFQQFWISRSPHFPHRYSVTHLSQNFHLQWLSVSRPRTTEQKWNRCSLPANFVKWTKKINSKPIKTCFFKNCI